MGEEPVMHSSRERDGEEAEEDWLRIRRESLTALQRYTSNSQDMEATNLNGDILLKLMEKLSLWPEPIIHRISKA